MIKPTKTTVRPASPDTSTTNRSNAGNGSGAIPGSSNILTPGTNRLPDTSIPHASGPPTTGAPHVVVSHITDPVINEANARLAEISLPLLQTHLLKPHGSVDGLFVAPGGQTYAHLEDGRHYRVELNTAGDYQIPWPAAPGVTPPILKKIDGQPRWRVDAQWYDGSFQTEEAICQRTNEPATRDSFRRPAPGVASSCNVRVPGRHPQRAARENLCRYRRRNRPGSQE